MLFRMLSAILNFSLWVRLVEKPPSGRFACLLTEPNVSMSTSAGEEGALAFHSQRSQTGRNFGGIRAVFEGKQRASDESGRRRIQFVAGRVGSHDSADTAK